MYRHEKLSLYFNVVIDTSLSYQQVFGMFFFPILYKKLLIILEE